MNQLKSIRKWRFTMKKEKRIRRPYTFNVPVEVAERFEQLVNECNLNRTALFTTMINEKFASLRVNSMKESPEETIYVKGYGLMPKRLVEAMQDIVKT